MNQGICGSRHPPLPGSASLGIQAALKEQERSLFSLNHSKMFQSSLLTPNCWPLVLGSKILYSSQGQPPPGSTMYMICLPAPLPRQAKSKTRHASPFSAGTLESSPGFLPFWNGDICKDGSMGWLFLGRSTELNRKWGFFPATHNICFWWSTFKQTAVRVRNLFLQGSETGDPDQKLVWAYSVFLMWMHITFK